MPEGVQRKRCAGWRMPANTVDVTRAGAFGNPYRLKDQRCLGGGRRWRIYGPGIVRAVSFGRLERARAEVVSRFRSWLKHPDQHALILKARRELRGKNLACWCPPGACCHRNVWLEIANG